MFRIALARCRTVPDWEEDDTPLEAALRERGARISTPAWDDRSVAWEEFDACLIRLTWDYMDRLDEYRAWARHVERSTRLFNGAETVAWNTHKSYLRTLEQAGLKIVPTVWLSRGASIDLQRTLDEREWTRAFLKPAVGANALKTLRCSAGERDRAQAFLDRHLQEQDMMLQVYRDRVERDGEFSAIFIDGECTHAVQKIPVAGDYRVQDDYGATDHLYTLPDQVLVNGRAALGLAPGELLYGRVDWLLDESGQYEINEVEVVEPSLFFRHSRSAAQRLAGALLARLDRG